MSVKRKSAFSIYSENPEKSLIKEFKKSEANDHSKAKLEGILKRTNQKKDIKTMKKKLSNISSSRLSESIGLFSNGKESGSKEFKTLGNDFEKNKKNKEKKKNKTEKKKNKKDKLECVKPAKKIKKIKNQPDKIYEIVDFEDDQIEYEPVMFDSRQEATSLFKRIIAPVKIKDFFG